MAGNALRGATSSHRRVPALQDSEIYTISRPSTYFCDMSVYRLGRHVVKEARALHRGFAARGGVRGFAPASLALPSTIMIIFRNALFNLLKRLSQVSARELPKVREYVAALGKVCAQLIFVISKKNMDFSLTLPTCISMQILILNEVAKRRTKVTTEFQMILTTRVIV